MRIAVIGLGSAGARHARLALELGHAVTGYDPEAPHPPGVDGAGELEAALAGAEASVIASPSSMHAEHALAAIEAGVPVLIEKPLAIDAADGQRVLAAAEAAGVRCGMAMNLRFHPGPAALKRLVEESKLGRILFARASFGYDLRLWRPETDYREGYSAQAALGGGILLDAIHEVDELLWLLGTARSVTAELAHSSDLEIDVEDIALATIRFESGAFAALDVNFLEPAYRRSCLLVGSEAVAEWDWVRETVQVRDRHGNLEELPAPAGMEDAYRAELSDFLEAVAKDRPPRTTAAEGAAAVAIVEVAKRSAAEGRRVELG
jgi:predicted dehydrogenase